MPGKSWLKLKNQKHQLQYNIASGHVSAHWRSNSNDRTSCQRTCARLRTKSQSSATNTRAHVRPASRSKRRVRHDEQDGVQCAEEKRGCVRKSRCLEANSSSNLHWQPEWLGPADREDYLGRRVGQNVESYSRDSRVGARSAASRGLARARHQRSSSGGLCVWARSPASAFWHPE